MKISKAAFDLIVSEEVSSKQLYETKYRRPVWPGVSSGATVGIGYDIGHHTAEQVRADWKGRIPNHMIEAMTRACGITGAAAQNITREIRSSVDIPWEEALTVFTNTDIPKWTAIVERELPNTASLSGDSLGALVSLTYNRGPSFSKQGDRYKEMRSIKAHMQSKNFRKIPAEIRAMKRIWPGVGGLLRRRDREAALFEAGLSRAPVAETITTTVVVGGGGVAAKQASDSGADFVLIGGIILFTVVVAAVVFTVVRRMKK